MPEGVLARVDAHAARLGLSRVEYIRRRLAADAATSGEAVSAADLRSFAEAAEDLQHRAAGAALPCTVTDTCRGRPMHASGAAGT